MKAEERLTNKRNGDGFLSLDFGMKEFGPSVIHHVIIRGVERRKI